MLVNSVHLVYCSDENYLEPTFVSAASAAIWATTTRPITIHLVGDNVSAQKYDEFTQKVEALNSSVSVICHPWVGDVFKDCRKWHGSSVIYARLMLQDILSNVDWVISLDGDTLWLGNPWELIKLADPTCLMQASIDPPSPGETEVKLGEWFSDNHLEMNPKEYLCVGLTILNLKLMREVNFSQQALDLLKRCPDPEYPEQMVMCYLSQGKIKPLPQQWGVFSVLHCGVDLTQPSLVHYVQDGPWRRDKLNRLFSDIVLVWFDFCRVVLREDRLNAFSWWTKMWRRGLFCLFKRCPWLLCHPLLRLKFRNAVGLPKGVRELFVEKWQQLAKGDAC